MTHHKHSLASLRFIPLILLIVLAGCSRGTAPHPSPPPPKIPWTGLLAQDRAVWSAEPGIDLLNGPAVVVRAYLESWRVAQATGDPGEVYPGFDQAVPPNVPGGPENPHSVDAPASARFLRPTPSTPAPHPVVGTERFHILRIGVLDRRVTAVVCDWSMFTRAWDLGDGKYGYDGPGDLGDGIAMSWVAMDAPASDPEPPLPPQRGPAPAPTNNVFDGWRVVGHLGDGGISPTNNYPRDWPSYEADGQVCTDKAPVPLGRRVFLRHGQHPRSDYPTPPPYPGWPAH